MTTTSIDDRGRLIKALEEAPIELKEAIAKILETSTSPSAKSIFFIRALKALIKLSKSDRLVETAAASSDYSLLLKALSSPEAMELLAATDPLAKAEARGILVKQQLIEASGGTYNSKEVADLLGISRQAVDKRRKNSKLIGIPKGKGSYLYPVWQFTSGKTIAGLELVMNVIKDLDPWMQVTFMLNPCDENQKNPIALLEEGSSDRAVEKAKIYLNDEIE